MKQWATEAQASIYLDNASTSYPKPPEVWSAIRDYIDTVGVSPGRGTYSLARTADNLVEETRGRIADLIGAGSPRLVAFAANATQALNTCIKGYLKAGDHVVTTAIEHNSVLRPLDSLSRAGVITYTVVEPTIDGLFDLSAFQAALTKKTRLLVANHASNVTGVVTPIASLAAIDHGHGAALLIDASQTAGALEIDVNSSDIDMLAFTGHKCLLGPPGTGGMYIKEPETVTPIVEGGTGSNSQSLRQPSGMPTKFEAGTLNYLGIPALGRTIDIVREEMPRIRKRLTTLINTCIDGLASISGVTVYCPSRKLERIPVLSFNVSGMYAGEVSAILDEDFNIMTRPGLQCAPLIHRTLKTSPHGTVRVSLGHATAAQDIENFLDAIEKIASSHRFRRL